jgi:hypothetical protein
VQFGLLQRFLKHHEVVVRVESQFGALHGPLNIDVPAVSLRH